jgi:amino acid transporter
MTGAQAEPGRAGGPGVDQQRHETPLQRLDRNWVDLLQELRVVQTGVQILTGFLVVLPFQSRFEDLTSFQTGIYLVTLCLAVLAMGFLIAPVSLHRLLFRRHARRVTVDVAHRLAEIGLVLLALAIVGVVLLIFDVVVGRTAAGIAAGAAALVLLALWVVLPLIIRERQSDPEHVEGAAG